jgi:hypothetical protein
MKAMLKIVLFISLLFVIGFIAAQEIEPNIDLGLIAHVNQGNSYVTFPTDIGNIEPLIFEGNLIPNFMIRHNKKSRLLGVFTPQIIIRMYNEFSYPVKTPSYMPQITTYYLIGNRDKSELLTVFGRLGHHSNGQNDDLLLEDGSINYNSGDFATNYIESGAIVTSLNRTTNAVRFFKTSFEYHPENSVHRLLNNKYSRYRWNSEFSAFRIPKGESKDKHKASLSMDIKTTWLFGNMDGTSNLSLDRLQASLTFSYYPTFLEDVGLFVQFYSGKDFYNVYFDEQRSLIRFGIMTNKLRF